MYKTSYDRVHTPKKADLNIVKNNMILKSSFNINGNGPMIYQTDYRANYIPLNSELDLMIKNIWGKLLKLLKICILILKK